jgi:glycosyltransferase involved in cell wall biosynthesis
MDSIVVGIPVHNHPESVLQCFKAVAEACEFADLHYRIVVVDDNSTPETVDYLIKQGIGLLHVPNTPAPNLGVAMNMAIAKCTDYAATYYFNVESDVYVEEDCLFHLIEAFHNHDDLGMVCPIFTDETKTAIRHAYPGHMGMALCGQHPDQVNQDVFVPWHHAGANLVLGYIARDPRCRVDESFKLWCCDFDWCWCVEDVFQKKLLVAHKARAVHVGNLSSGTVDRDSFESESEANIRVRNKWHRRYL